MDAQRACPCRRASLHQPRTPETGASARLAQPARIGRLFPIRFAAANRFHQRRSMARQFIYHMQGLTKAYPTRKVLENINLSFYPDAKIGVLGVNGSGKSTLLRIMAGI